MLMGGRWTGSSWGHSALSGSRAGFAQAASCSWGSHESSGEKANLLQSWIWKVLLQHSMENISKNNKTKQVLGEPSATWVCMQVLQKFERCCSRLVDVGLRSEYLWYPHILHIALGAKGKWNIGYRQFLLTFFAAVVFCNVFSLYIYSDISSDLGLSLCLDWSEGRGPKAGEKLMKASKVSCWSTDPLHFLGDHVHAVWKADQQQMCKQLALPIHGSVSALYNPGNAAILGFLTWLHKALPPRDLVNNFGKVGWAIVKSSVLAGGPGSVPPNQSPSRSCGLIWNATESPHCSVCVRFKS